MQQLLLHIEYLTRHHDCVILPGVGAFISKEHSARFNESAASYSAPYRSVSFNVAITNNDGLIASSIARREGIPYDEAALKLSEATERLRAVLNEDSEVELPGVGRLELREGRLTFMPADARRQMAQLGFTEAVAGGIEPSEEIAETPVQPQRNPDYWYIPIHKQTARIAATLLIVFAVALGVILPLTDAMYAPAMDKASVMPVERIEKAVKKIEPTRGEETKNVKTESSPDYRHYLIVGTFHTQKEAETYVNQHKERGHDLQIVAGRSVMRVSAAASNDEKELRERLSNPEFKREFKEAWVWTKK